MISFEIGLALNVDSTVVRRCLSEWFPALPSMSLDERPSDPGELPPIVFRVRAMGAADFPSLIDFVLFPGEPSDDLEIGRALARRFSRALGCRATADGSGLGDGESPYGTL